MLLAAESPLVAGEKEPSLYGGTLNLGWYRKAGSLNPLSFPESISVPLRDLIFNKLVRMNKNAQYEPDLASSWSVSEDGKTYTFHLRPDVKFHDGVELTSEDVLYTFQLFSDKAKSPYFYNNFENVKEWKTSGRHVFQVVLKEPFAPFLNSLWHTYILPKPNEKRFIDQEKNPIGTGPFTFISEGPDGNILLKAYEDYFGGRPFLDAIQVEIFPSKKHMWAAFLRNEIDLLFYLNREDYKAIQDNTSLQIFETLAAGAYVLVFNFRDPVMKDLRVRNAISHGINRSEILEMLEDGEGKIVDGPFHPDSLDTGNTLSFDYDPTKAKKIVEEIYPNQLKLSLVVDKRNEHLMRIAKLIRQQLQEVGIYVQLHFFSSDQQLSELTNGTAPFQCYLLAYNLQVLDTLSYQWHSSAPFNLGKFSDPEIDRLIEAVLRENDLNTKNQLYLKIRERFLQENPAFFLYVYYVFHAASSKIQNAEALLGPFIPFHQLKEVKKDVESNERG